MAQVGNTRLARASRSIHLMQRTRSVVAQIRARKCWRQRRHGEKLGDLIIGRGIATAQLAGLRCWRVAMSVRHRQLGRPVSWPPHNLNGLRGESRDPHNRPRLRILGRYLTDSWQKALQTITDIIVILKLILLRHNCDCSATINVSNRFSTMGTMIVTGMITAS